MAIVLVLVAIYWGKVKKIGEDICAFLGSVVVYAGSALIILGVAYLFEASLDYFFHKQISYIWCFLFSLAIFVICGKENA